MTRLPENTFINSELLSEAGLTENMIREGITYTYLILDIIDRTLLSNKAFRLANMMELANLSTFIGNLFAAGIAKEPSGVFKRNGPHKYPDLLAQKENSKDIEVKVALESNKPKGHLAKEGYYLTCRYVLGDEDGAYILGQRGDVVWIWEIRFGILSVSDFNTSNTEGDSGKTAVVNAEGMKKLNVIYCDLDRMPYSRGGKNYREYRDLFLPKLDMFE
ncbi:MAG: hypothetical protein OHK0022_36400 [Roseiflexaceae bacterium]